MLKYSLIVRLAFPTVSAPKELKIKESDLIGAVNGFNTKFLGVKKLILDKVEDIAWLTLETKKPVKNPTREITVLSQILKNQYGWSKYSEAPTRLFNVTLLNNPFIVETSGVNTIAVANNITEILEMQDIEELRKIVEDIEYLLKVANAKKTILEAQQLL